jgi:hypothetical protein
MDSIGMIASLVHEGLATAQREVVTGRIGPQRVGVAAWEGRGVDLAGGTAVGGAGGSEIFSKTACSVLCRW